MKHSILSILALALIALSSSCSKQYSPSDVAELYYQAIINKDFAKAVTYTSADSADYQEGAAFIELFMNDLGDNPSFKAISDSISDDGKTAKVKIHSVTFDEEADFNVDMVLKDNQWKVLFM